MPKLALGLLVLLMLAGGDAVAADPVRDATDAWLASVPADVRARSDAYFEGGYWLQLWSFLITAGVSLLLLTRGWSTRIRQWCERRTSGPNRVVLLYWLGYLALTSVITLPWTWYTGFSREHAYGLSTQTFGAWLADWAKGLGVAAVFGGIAVMVLYAVFRRAPRNWWLWGAGVGMVLVVIATALGPVYIAPLFNDFTPLADGEVKRAVLQMAHANGVTANEVFMSDASAQSTRISANVAGMFGTERITLNDNLLQRCSLEEILAVTGHELGHYVLGHVYEGMVFFSAFAFVSSACVRAGFVRLQARFGERWGVRGIGDPAGLPLLSLLVTTFMFVATPVTNSYIRSNEAEADIFGLNAARQPDAFAKVALDLAEYRKLDPTPLEELIFYDHPSGRSRIEMAMRFKLAQPDAQ